MIFYNSEVIADEMFAKIQCFLLDTLKASSFKKADVWRLCWNQQESAQDALLISSKIKDLHEIGINSLLKPLREIFTQISSAFRFQQLPLSRWNYAD